MGKDQTETAGRADARQEIHRLNGDNSLTGGRGGQYVWQLRHHQSLSGRLDAAEISAESATLSFHLPLFAGI